MKRLFAAITIISLLISGSPLQVIAQAPSAAPTTAVEPPVGQCDMSEAALRARGLIFIDCQALIGKGGGLVEGSGGSCTDLSLPTILDKAGLAAAINANIEEINPDSPMKGLGMDFVEGSVRAGINPLLMVTQARKESSFGAPVGVAGIPGIHNAFGRRAGSSQPNIEGWFKYDSWAKSLNDPTNPEYDHPTYAQKFLVEERGNNTLDMYLNTYAPPTENDTSQYAKDVRQWMAELAAKAGSALSCGSGSASGSKIAEIAAGEVGNAEASYNCGPTIEKYFSHSGVGCGLAWCGFFITWVYAQAGIEITSSNNGYVPTLGVWFLENKFFFYKDDPYTPQPGDIYIKVNSGSGNVPMTMEYGDHIGIVEKVEGTTLHTIDGNYGDAVQRRTFENFNATDSPIIGFGRFVDKATVKPDGGPGNSSGPGGSGGSGSEL